MATTAMTKTKWFGRLGDEGGNFVFDFFPHWKEPGCWGVILADIAHHVAEAYAQRSGTFDPRPILREILRIANREIRNPRTQRKCLASREPVRPVRRAAGGGGGR